MKIIQGTIKFKKKKTVLYRTEEFQLYREPSSVFWLSGLSEHQPNSTFCILNKADSIILNVSQAIFASSTSIKLCIIFRNKDRWQRAGQQLNRGHSLSRMSPVHRFPLFFVFAISHQIVHPDLQVGQRNFSAIAFSFQYFGLTLCQVIDSL